MALLSGRSLLINHRGQTIVDMTVGPERKRPMAGSVNGVTRPRARRGAQGVGALVRELGQAALAQEIDASPQAIAERLKNKSNAVQVIRVGVRCAPVEGRTRLLIMLSILAGRVDEWQRQMRKQRGWTQLALTMSKGIGQSELSKYENGRMPSYETMCAIARAFEEDPPLARMR
jgi:DNA-binding XRE family transcriptional regulator